MDIPAVLPLSFEKNLQYFQLVARHLSLHRTMTWWLRSAGCQRLARGLHVRHNRTLSWSLWNYDRAPSDVLSAFPPAASSWISVLWYSFVIWNWLLPLPRSVLPGLLACWGSHVAWPCYGDKSGWSFCSFDKVVCCLSSAEELSMTLSSLWAIVHWSGFSDIRQSSHRWCPVLRVSESLLGCCHHQVICRLSASVPLSLLPL